MLGCGTAEKQTKIKAIKTIYGGICMAREYEKCMLHSVEYKSTSTMGNPSYWVFFTDSQGEFQRGYTGSNSSSGYTIRNYRYCDSGTVIYMKYHFTRKTGSCIIDFIKHNTPEEASREAEASENQNCFSVSDFSKDKNINRQFTEVLI